MQGKNPAEINQRSCVAIKVLIWICVLSILFSHFILCIYPYKYLNMSNLLFSVKKPISVQSHQIKDSLMLSFNEGEKKITQQTKPNQTKNPSLSLRSVQLSWIGCFIWEA